MEACSGWRRYKGLRRPRCADGWGCHKCWGIHNKRRYAKLPQFNKFMKAMREECPDAFDFSDEEFKDYQVEELCWQFFMRGLELSLGPAPNNGA